MTELTEMDVMRAMVRAGIGKVGVYSLNTDLKVIGRCDHKVNEFSGCTNTVAWRPRGWTGCAQCILTCDAILEDPDMPTESEELALRAELAPSCRLALPPLTVAVPMVAVLSFALGALLL